MASPTSPCVYPSFILFCLNIFENFSNSSKSVLSSGGKSNRCGNWVDGCKAAELTGINGDRLLGYILFGSRLPEEKPLPGNMEWEFECEDDVVIGVFSPPSDDGEERCNDE